MIIRQITVVGSGTMGRGIAYASAMSGYQTLVYDVSQHALDSASSGIGKLFSTGVEKGKIDQASADAAAARLQYSHVLEAASAEADVIIEAIPEDMALKRDLFAQVDLFCGPNTLLASNTSSISITELATVVERRDRFIGLHFFNPVHIMKLVEIVVGERTSDETVTDAKELAISLGKKPIVVRDFPGFATSRLGIALGMEAIRMVEQGVASPEDIDTAMELGYNHPLGPLELTDLVGLDVRLSIAEYLASTLGARFEPPDLLRNMVKEGKLGKKSGRGFYEWDE